MINQDLSQWQCAGCAVEFPPAQQPPKQCPICEDERQYIPGGVQHWVTCTQLEQAGKSVQLTELEPNLTAIRAPRVGIEQSGLLVQTAHGNLLFDIPGLITQEAIAKIQALGGISAIVASHPHMYGVQSQYSAAFDDAPIYVAQADSRWLQRTDAPVQYWSDSFEVLPGISLHQIGGHFPGSTLALWQNGANGHGALLAGDAVFPVADGNVTFLRSYPNQIPLSARVVRRMALQLSTLSFERLYNNFATCVPKRAGEIVQFSARRYAGWADGDHDDLT